MQALKIATQSISYLPNILGRIKKRESFNEVFIKWFLVWYLGSSVLLLLSLHSYFMGFDN